MKKQECVCSLCCFGFPCDQYTWESACKEAFRPGAVEAVVEAEGLEIVEMIVLEFKA